MKKNQIAETNSRKNQTKVASASRGNVVAKSQEIFQELREIKKEVKEVKKLLVVNSLRRLVDNYDKIISTKQKKLEKEWELAEKDEKRKKEIAEWDRIQAEDEENLRN